MPRTIEIDDLCNMVEATDPRLSPDQQWIAYVHITIDRLKNDYQRNIWLAPTTGGSPIQLTRSGKDTQPRWSPDGQWLAFTSARQDDKPQVYLLRVASPGGEPRQLSSMPNGATEPAWSPDSTRIAFLAGMNAEERAREDSDEDEAPPDDEMEARHRKERHEYEEKQRVDPRIHTRLPYRSGTNYLGDHYRQVYVISIKEGAEPHRLTDFDEHYTRPVWMGEMVLTTRPLDPTLDAAWRYNAIVLLDSETGAETILTEDDHTDYEPTPSPDGQWIAYLRTPFERSSRANMRLAIIPAEGGSPRDLTLGLDRSVKNLRWVGAHPVISVPNEGHTEIFAIHTDSGDFVRMVGGDLEAEFFDVGSNESVAFTAATSLCPPEVFWKSTPESELVQLTAHNHAWLADVIVQETHEIRFQAPDEQEIQGWYLLPADFDPQHQYPMILSIHGGPHVMFGPSFRTMWHEWQVQAGRGYVVFYCNPRGSDGYGDAFRDGLVAQGWGTSDMPDQMAGVDAMLALGFVDPERLMVTGGSYGGFMTAWIISHTDRFKAAVTQRGVYHLMGFYGSTDIPFFVYNEHQLIPWEEPETLWRRSPVAHAQQIHTPLLIIHAENDFRVPIPDAELLFTLLRQMGKTVKMVRYPRDGHELSRTGEPKHRLSRLTYMLEWFDMYKD